MDETPEQSAHAGHQAPFRSDCGGEYTGGDFATFLKSQGTTERRPTAHDTHQDNRFAESRSCWLLERIRAVLHHFQLPKSLWGEAISFYCLAEEKGNHSGPR